MKTVLRMALSIAVAASAGCGSSAGKSTGAGGNGGGGNGGSTGDASVNGTCAFTACGGDLVGTWHFMNICSLGPSTSCPPYEGVTIDWAGTQATYTFGSDGSFRYAFMGRLSETIRYPLNCISAGTDAGVSETCEAFEAAVLASVHRPDAGTISMLTSFTCSTDADICVCHEVFDDFSQTETGTYTTSGNQIAITVTGATLFDAGVADAGTFPLSDYCVSGNTLAIRSPSTSGNEVVTTLTR